MIIGMHLGAFIIKRDACGINQVLVYFRRQQLREKMEQGPKRRDIPLHSALCRCPLCNGSSGYDFTWCTILCVFSFSVWQSLSNCFPHWK